MHRTIATITFSILSILFSAAQAQDPVIQVCRGGLIEQGAVKKLVLTVRKVSADRASVEVFIEGQSIGIAHSVEMYSFTYPGETQQRFTVVSDKRPEFMFLYDQDMEKVRTSRFSDPNYKIAVRLVNRNAGLFRIKDMKSGVWNGDYMFCNDQ